MNNGTKIFLKDLESRFNKLDEEWVNREYNRALQDINFKIVVLDDDPTGVQTVHGVSVYTDWSKESISAGFAEKNPLFFILTNSRSFSREKTAQVHQEIAESLINVSQKTGRDFLVVSRGDSTLRGHYPLETQVLRDTIEANSDILIDGEIIIPFFKEGGRFTVGDIHYLLEGETLIPVAETEFAKDRTFGYNHSHLGEWLEAKTASKYRAQEVEYISLRTIRELNTNKIEKQLQSVKDFNKVVVNALDYSDLKIFMVALTKVLATGKRFLFRTAASFLNVIGGIPSRGLLLKEELFKEETRTGGLIIIGSHVQKTTEQLKAIEELNDLEFIEFNQHLVLIPGALENEVRRVVSLCNKNISNGKTVVVFTRRERLDLDQGDPELELKIAVEISAAVTDIVAKLEVKPRFLIAKGGITSSDIGCKGLGVKKALVAGQIKPGIPVWILGPESKYPGMPFIIFPGNVGKRETLLEIIQFLN